MNIEGMEDFKSMRSSNLRHLRWNTVLRNTAEEANSDSRANRGTCLSKRTVY